MERFRAAGLAALFICFFGPVVLAQDITLTSHDGSVTISGSYLGFDGEFYRVDTIYGELTVDGSGVSCEGPACPNLTDFVAEVEISGAAAMGEVLMPALIEAFAISNGYAVERASGADDRLTYVLSEPATGAARARFVFRAGVSDEGFADLLADEADIAMSLREVRSDEIRRAREAGLGDLSGKNRSRVLALDALVPVVAPNNPLRSVLPTQLAELFAGQITNWSELGGPDAPITLHLLRAGSGMAQSVEDRLLKPAGLTLSENIVRHDKGEALSNAVARDPFGIGIASFAEIGNTTAVTLTGSCGFPLSATRRTIKTEDYPLTSPMFLYLPARRLPKIAREFLAYTRGPAAQIVIRRAGFVDQAPEEIPIGVQGDRIANAIRSAGAETSLEDLQSMVERLTPMRRLSTSFRFEPGSVRLDAQSRSNVQQLARALEAGRYDGREMVFIGFSDGNGSAVANKDIAQRRAQAVETAISQAAETANFERLTIESIGYGEALPMACDDSAWGRKANRRVEVWVK